ETRFNDFRPTAKACGYGSLLSQGRRDTPPRSRGANAPELCKTHWPKTEGAGNTGCAMHPQSRVQKVKSTRGSHHRYSGAARHSPRNGFTAYFVISPVIGLVCHRRQRNYFRQLDASVEASGPHDFAVRLSTVRQPCCQRPPHPVPNVRDDRETPLCVGRDGGSV